MYKVIDLSMELYDGILLYDFLTAFKVVHTAKVEKDGFELTDVTISSHTGTHFDAPLHFVKNGETIERLNLNKMVGKVVVFDLSSLGPRSPITAKNLEDCNVSINKGDVAVIYTGIERLAGQPDYFTEHSFLTKQAAEWLIEKGVVLVGVDMPSVDSLAIEPHSFDAHLTSFIRWQC
jgi:arylformamidase